MMNNGLEYAPDQALYIGIAVLVIGTLLFVGTLALTKWLAQRGKDAPRPNPKS